MKDFLTIGTESTTQVLGSRFRLFYFTYLSFYSLVIYILNPNFYLPSDETNCPMIEEDPSAFSAKVTSEIILFSSKTEPHPIQTVSPLAGSVSKSVDLQLGQTFGIFAVCHT